MKNRGSKDNESKTGLSNGLASFKFWIRVVQYRQVGSSPSKILTSGSIHWMEVNAKLRCSVLIDRLFNQDWSVEPLQLISTVNDREGK